MDLSRKPAPKTLSDLAANPTAPNRRTPVAAGVVFAAIALIQLANHHAARIRSETPAPIAPVQSQVGTEVSVSDSAAQQEKNRLLSEVRSLHGAPIQPATPVPADASGKMTLAEALALEQKLLAQRSAHELNSAHPELAKQDPEWMRSLQELDQQADAIRGMIANEAPGPNIYQRGTFHPRVTTWKESPILAHARQGRSLASLSAVAAPLQAQAMNIAVPNADANGTGSVCSVKPPAVPDAECRANYVCPFCGGCCCLCEALRRGLN